MSETTKIAFSADEWECLHNTDFFKAKQNNTHKIMHYFSDIAALYKERIVAQDAPLWNSTLSPKISKGENYKGLPYIVLDYPRIKDDTANYILVRTFLGWGKSISLQMIIAGHFKNNWHIADSLNDVWINANKESLWDNDICAPGFIPIRNATDTKIFAQQNIKLACRWPLDTLIDDAFSQTLVKAFDKLLSVLT